MSNTRTINIKNYEGKWIQFTVRRRNPTTGARTAIDLTSAELSFVVKTALSDLTYKISKSTSDFDKTDAASGIVKVNLSTTDTAVGSLPAGTYIAGFKAVFASGTDEDISETINLKVETTPFHN